MQAVLALLVAVAVARPAENSAVEENDNDDLQTAQQFHRLGGFGGFGGGFEKEDFNDPGNLICKFLLFLRIRRIQWIQRIQRLQRLQRI